mmetsp:Transcript_26384/g.38988  ORF Transcript_26384/g.38988 Transcript_26384/m.38988 type:complete len:579 (+) Transcript_26384:254-1990(+)|eukprot:CAMPEP_0194211064 /NCGR_PEP_ID=MMETSP0156-20130528/9262_1 /TAXON_ID=33649 /ORGANISM="Thalassionema nitzschioides, Strain L26-B" /LENGTH=578 /DNA_ID=CAMNT_0038938489 /DNA_START=225 /DNA_END=1961 /DNA_ORIENTATION=-
MATSDTTLHDLCKGFGALLSRSKNPSFPEEASRLNERGNLPLHAACSFQATADVIEALLKAYPGGASQPNSAGNLPIHQAAMWQAPTPTVELLMGRHPEGATVRNQYGSLPLHMAASNQASIEVVKLLIDAYPDALHLQNDDGMTPLDLALADGDSSSEAVIALLEGRPPPPELTRRQKADKYEERAKALERKLASLVNSGGRQGKDLHEALLCVRRLADRFPHALYAAGLDPNELELLFSERETTTDAVLMDAVKKRSASVLRDSRGAVMTTSQSSFRSGGPRDRVEDLLASIVGLDHVKSQVRGLRRTTELSDLKESLLPSGPTRTRAQQNTLSLLPPALLETGRPMAHPMVFLGNPGTGKTAVARLLAKAYHELGLLRKPKFLEVERMDLVGRNKEQTILKTREVLDEARGGILFIDEAYTLGMASKRSRMDTGVDAMQELIAAEGNPLIILAGFPVEMQTFLTHQPELRKKFPVTFEFPDYTCAELARIFLDFAAAKGFEIECPEDEISALLEQETTVSWRTERNGRVCELLMAGCRTQVRRRMRQAQMEEDDDFDPNLIIKRDIEAVMQTDFK